MLGQVPQELQGPGLCSRHQRRAAEHFGAGQAMSGSEMHKVIKRQKHGNPVGLDLLPTSHFLVFKPMMDMLMKSGGLPAEALFGSGSKGL